MTKGTTPTASPLSSKLFGPKGAIGMRTVRRRLTYAIPASTRPRVRVGASRQTAERRKRLAPGELNREFERKIRRALAALSRTKVGGALLKWIVAHRPSHFPAGKPWIVIGPASEPRSEPKQKSHGWLAFVKAPDPGLSDPQKRKMLSLFVHVPKGAHAFASQVRAAPPTGRGLARLKRKIMGRGVRRPVEVSLHPLFSDEVFQLAAERGADTLEAKLARPGDRGWKGMPFFAVLFHELVHAARVGWRVANPYLAAGGEVIVWEGGEQRVHKWGGLVWPADSGLFPHAEEAEALLGDPKTLPAAEWMTSSDGRQGAIRLRDHLAAAFLDADQRRARTALLRFNDRALLKELKLPVRYNHSGDDRYARFRLENLLDDVAGNAQGG